MPMDVQRLTSDETLLGPIRELRSRIQQPACAISDLVDDAGNQYVDLVMEGGGMLGIALVGYTWALEEMGIRFLGIGGTSAGSINALLLAAMADPAEAKSPRLLAELADMNFYDFVDGDGSDDGRDRTRRLIECAMDGEPTGFIKGSKLLWRYRGVRPQLLKRYGLNRGDAFEQWLAGLLAQAGVRTTADLEARMARIPPLSIRAGVTPPDDWQPRPGRLVVVATDITTETRAEFPAMARLYWADPAAVSPACYARASMSIPYFFETFRVTDLPEADTVVQPWWRDTSGESFTIAKLWKALGVDLAEENAGKVPSHILFVDGGITSNFPIDAFHDNTRVPVCPTFGVKLQHDDRYKEPDKLPLEGDGGRRPLASLGGAMFNSARHTLDYEFIKRNPDYRHLVQFIPCTYEEDETDPTSGTTRKAKRQYNWLDFNMSEKDRAGLFKQGAEKAIEFVDRFSSQVKTKQPDGSPGPTYDSRWAYYKALRARRLAPPQVVEA